MAKNQAKRATKPTIPLDDYKRKYIVRLHNDGVSFNEIAKDLNVSISTLYKWRKEDKKLEDLLIQSSDILASNVEHTLYKRAMGFTIEEEKLMKDKSGEIVTKSISKVILPDVEAMKFYLTNVAGDRWKNRQDNSHSVRQVVKRNVKRFDGRTE